MSLSRRKFMSLLGGGTLLGASGVSVGFIATRTPNEALQPWNRAGAYSEPRRHALSYAILAPNPHNRQPWIADLGAPNQVKLYVDNTRLLKETDPYDRQITIGLGCFLELMVLAAAEDGYRVQLALFPEGSNRATLDSRPVAVATFIKSPDIKKDPLFQFILDRRSNKEPYDITHSVDDGALAALRASAPHRVFTSNEPGLIEILRHLTWRAFEREYVTPPKLKESIDLMRLGKSEINANPDGIDLGGPFLESLMVFGVLNRKALGDPSSRAWKQGLDMYRDICSTAMGYVWINTDTNDRIDQIEAGRTWVRLNLAATQIGLGIHPMSQALQEYPEMVPLYREAHDQLAPEGGTVQMLGRLGYAPNPMPSPRWPLETKLVHV